MFKFTMFSTILAITACGCLSANPIPQVSDSNLWKTLIVKNSSIKKSCIYWKLDRHEYAYPELDPNKSAAYAYAAEIHAGSSETLARAVSEAILRRNQDLLRGIHTTGIAHFEFNGKTLLSDVQYKAEKLASSSNLPYHLEVREIIDDKYRISIRRSVKSNYTELSGWEGELRTDPNNAGTSTFGAFAGNLRGGANVLVGTPLSQIYPIPASTASLAYPHDILLQRQVNQGKLPLLVRCHVSDKYSRPIMIEIVDGTNGKTRNKYTADGYKLYNDSIWFPSHVQILQMTESGAVLQDEEYNLISAKFNALAKTDLISNGLPIGTHLDDYRFDKNIPVSYAANHGIPSDQKVFSIRPIKDDKLTTKPRRSAVGVYVVCGVMIAFVAILLWRRRR
ncbi:hypothetical protein CCAX7_59800 [Capsulimonas corticalis]|uniref:Uncharacterized protein n=1 Tax=Capsulimonas corticalis TaxID=2219043 RepID=A0A402CZK0_9BACT|nr:hypothetical protein [Capsulimonas corticalis]BDI33929.1 hypothetical protein CCAX7_59800 [Capsulimonas corticalis]